MSCTRLALHICQCCSCIVLIYSYEEGSFRWFPDQLTFRFSCTEIGGSWQIHISSPTADMHFFPQNWPNHIMGWCHPKWMFVSPSNPIIFLQLLSLFFWKEKNLVFCAFSWKLDIQVASCPFATTIWLYRTLGPTSAARCNSALLPDSFNISRAMVSSAGVQSGGGKIQKLALNFAWNGMDIRWYWLGYCH